MAGPSIVEEGNLLLLLHAVSAWPHGGGVGVGGGESGREAAFSGLPYHIAASYLICCSPAPPPHRPCLAPSRADLHGLHYFPLPASPPSSLRISWFHIFHAEAQFTPGWAPGLHLGSKGKVWDYESVCVCVCVCVRACFYVCGCVWVWVHTRMHASVCVHMHACAQGGGVLLVTRALSQLALSSLFTICHQRCSSSQGHILWSSVT